MVVVVVVPVVTSVAAEGLLTEQERPAPYLCLK